MSLLTAGLITFYIMIAFITIFIIIVHLIIKLLKWLNISYLYKLYVELTFFEIKCFFFFYDLYFYVLPVLLVWIFLIFYRFIIYLLWGELAAKLSYLNMIGPEPYYYFPGKADRTLSPDASFAKYGYRIDSDGRRYLSFNDVITLLKNTDVKEGDILSFSLTTIRYKDKMDFNNKKIERLYDLHVYDQQYNPVLIVPVSGVNVGYGPISDKGLDWVDLVPIDSICMGALDGNKGIFELLINMRVVGDPQGGNWILVPDLIRFICYPIGGIN